jgi:hypothetical protein
MMVLAVEEGNCRKQEEEVEDQLSRRDWEQEEEMGSAGKVPV